PTPRPTPTPVPSPSPNLALSAPGPIVTQDWSGPFVPAAVAVASDSGLVLVGAVGDESGNGIVATSADAGANWRVERLSVPALGTVTAAGTTIWASTACPVAATSGCSPDLIVSTDNGLTWQLSPMTGTWHPDLLDDERGWTLSPIGAQQVSTISTISTTADGGATWSAGRAVCGATAPVADWLSFPSAAAGWLACVGDSGVGSQTKQLLRSVDLGRTWSLLSAISTNSGVKPVGTMPLDGQLGGISMLASGQGWLWTSQGLFASSDGGRTWAPIAYQDPTGGTIVLGAGLTGTEGTDGTTGMGGYALVRDGATGVVRLTVSSDGGQTWQDVHDWPPAH
ncbi:MAG: WD40/YVTN/BNR-like repeat-containing protein, partial [Candidatus Limnocylindrales bacterium]